MLHQKYSNYCSRLRGSWGEYLAARYLIKNGHYIWFRNWKCSKGELDLIAYRGDTLLIIEVKSRKLQISSIFTPEEALDIKKERKLLFLSSIFVRRFGRELRARRLRHIRLDLITVRVGRWGILGTQLDHFESFSSRKVG